MRIRSDSFEHRGPLAAEFALGAPGGFGGNRNPHLAWEDAPAGTRSFALMCIDTDAPTDPATVGRADMDIPVDQPRTDFVHWVMVDIPADVREIAAGSCSDGVSKGGKQSPHGPDGARQGLNDYTGWFAGDHDMAGDYYGYDGPCPPWNDSIVHRYVFTVYALDVERVPLMGRFSGADARKVIAHHLLGEASITGIYTLNPRLASGRA